MQTEAATLASSRIATTLKRANTSEKNRNGLVFDRILEEKKSSGSWKILAGCWGGGAMTSLDYKPKGKGNKVL